LAHGVEVRVNPELGLMVGENTHLIKLYMKADKLPKNRIDVIAHLMHRSLKKLCEKGTIMSVLDVRRGRLISPSVPIDGLDAALDAELAYIGTLWPQI